MRIRPRLLLVLWLSLFAIFPVTAMLCGTERWQVKVCQDNHVKYLFKDFDTDTAELIPTRHTTISKLQAYAWPFGTKKHPPKWSWYQRSTSKVEYQIWEVNARFFKKKNEADQDYHLILKSGQRTLVAEVPHPDCVEDTPEPLKSMILQARADFDTWFAAHADEGPEFNQKVRVTGVGMFDTLGHAEGTSPNGIELHPVIKIEFLD